MTRKYRNQPTEVDGIRFASKAEARRYGELKLLEKAGAIHSLELQPRFELHVDLHAGRLHGRKVIGHYVADFSYFQYVDGCTRRIVEDVKGIETALFKWKRKHFEAEYGIKLRVVKSGRMQREIDG